MDMGYPDYGGGPKAGVSAGGHQNMPGMTNAASVSSSVKNFTGPTRGRPDVAMTLEARKQRFSLASGESVDGYTLNGTSPGPTIRAVQGQLVQVQLVNRSVPGGVALHWHGLDVPNAEDGVAGVTQDAVPVGGSYTYRFIAGQAGTFWYHSHQLSHEQVVGGRLGPLVITQGPSSVHPMHLHGHHAVVLSRNGVPSTGSPWWVDSLKVANGESYDIGFVADNPGIWMDHCHNLPHASQGLVAHLVYEGVTEPFRVGGSADNQSE